MIKLPQEIANDLFVKGILYEHVQILKETTNTNAIVQLAFKFEDHHKLILWAVIDEQNEEIYDKTESAIYKTEAILSAEYRQYGVSFETFVWEKADKVTLPPDFNKITL